MIVVGDADPRTTPQLHRAVRAGAVHGAPATHVPSAVHQVITHQDMEIIDDRSIDAAVKLA
jgi:hypothetical protein